MLETDWIKVATAGKTIDGREITPEMLTRAAELYGLDTYTAVINSEHFFFPGLGHVTAAKSEADDQGRTALWAKLLPTAEFIARNHNRRQLFYSVELMPGFPKEGDWYLSGLAITDMPASQGLAPQMFKASERRVERFTNTAAMELGRDGRFEPRSPTELAARSPDPDEEAPGWTRSFLASIKALLGGGGISDTLNEEEAMKPEERKELDELKATVGMLTTAVEKLTAAQAKTDPKADEPPPAEAPAEGSELPDVVKAAVIEAVKPIQGEIDAIKASLGQESPGTQPLEVTQPSEGGGGFVF